MNLFYDTSVMVASSSVTHPHYGPAMDAIGQLRDRANQGWMSPQFS